MREATDFTYNLTRTRGQVIIHSMNKLELPSSQSLMRAINFLQSATTQKDFGF